MTLLSFFQKDNCHLPIAVLASWWCASAAARNAESQRFSQHAFPTCMLQRCKHKVSIGNSLAQPTDSSVDCDPAPDCVQPASKSTSCMHQLHVHSWSASRPNSVTPTGKLQDSSPKTLHRSFRRKHAQASCRHIQRQGTSPDHASLRPHTTLHTGRNNSRMPAVIALSTEALEVTVGQDFVSLANDLADAAAKVTTKYFRCDAAVLMKYNVWHA